jgi:hypothetical protein
MVRSIEKTDQQLMRSYKALEQSRELLKRVRGEDYTSRLPR